MANKNYFLNVAKGWQSFRAGEEQMDKLARIFIHRQGACRNISATLRDIIDRQYELEEPNMSNQVKKLKYNNLK